MIDKIGEASLLFDFYGQMLTKKQQEVMRLYHEENYSLSEIGEEFSISRQGVHDTLKKAEHALTEYEEKLGLIAKFLKCQILLEEIEKDLLDCVDREKDEQLQRGCGYAREPGPHLQGRHACGPRQADRRPAEEPRGDCG